MKLTRNLTQKPTSLCFLLFLTTIYMLQGCSEDDQPGLPFNKTPGDGEFYRLKGFGSVDVISENRQVRVLVRVTDSLNFGVTNLDKSDFEVLENNIDKVNDVEANTKIDPDSIPFTIKTVLLLDLSSSVEGKIAEIKTAVKELIQAKVPDQEFALYTFDSKVKLVQEFTSSTSSLIAAVNSLPDIKLDASTNLFQAIIEASGAWQDNIGIDRIEEGSMIIFTDGKHNADPGLRVEDAIDALDEKSVYVAALDGPNLDQPTLIQIVGDENKYIFANDVSKLASVFLEIQDKILTQSKSIYYITYTSPISVPGTQNLKIMINNNRNPGADCLVEKAFSTDGF
ncbi:VWA domain-containing protein [Fulvivirgaceae bacterium BMA12]|uniref:VWA domain-containing protein n=1 Tax=Agaribacillus aureus TaxID=3051825 RepID=A0ABT8LCW5_9BACT|nr:VWA domain-containing protein [Fulvivirgaceae bacterium BMA12]